MYGVHFGAFKSILINHEPLEIMLGFLSQIKYYKKHIAQHSNQEVFDAILK